MISSQSLKEVGAKMPHQNNNADKSSNNNNSTKINASSSLISKVDPVVRALNTIMYGLVVHFGTLWMIESSYTAIHSDNTTATEDIDTTQRPNSSLLLILFLHEYWIYLQHTNVLSNPLLQHLDRQYGIALLKNNKHWSIAGKYLVCNLSTSCALIFELQF